MILLNSPSFLQILGLIFSRQKVTILSPVLPHFSKILLFACLRHRLTILHPSPADFKYTVPFSVTISPHQLKIIPEAYDDHQKPLVCPQINLPHALQAMFNRQLIITSKPIVGFSGLPGFCYLIFQNNFQLNRLLFEIDHNPTKFEIIIKNAYAEAQKYRQ